MGRIIDFVVEPLCFGEFLDLLQLEDLPTVQSLEDLLSFKAPQISSKRLALFEQFLAVGGFPESTLMLSRNIPVAEIQQYIVKSIISKILTKDLQKYFNLNYVDQDLALFKILCNEAGSQINYKNISKDISLSEELVAKHFSTFHKASLIRILNKFDSKLRRVINAHPKYYPASACLALSYLGHSQIPQGSLVGHLVEGYVYERLQRLCKYDEIYFATPTRSSEIDFYIPNQKLLAECKYTANIKSSLLEQLVKYGDQFSLKPLLFTKQDLGNAQVIGIPACCL